MSMLSKMGDAGLSSGRDDVDGEGDSTTDGIRLCLPFLVLSPSGSKLRVKSFVLPISTSESAAMSLESLVGEAVGADVEGDSDQDQSKPGLSMRFIVSPLFTGYSFRSLPSTSALPRSNKRCASAGGARGCEASCDLIEATVSVMDTVNGNECGGFATLKTRPIESVRTSLILRSQYVCRIERVKPDEDASDDACLTGGAGRST